MTRSRAKSLFSSSEEIRGTTGHVSEKESISRPVLATKRKERAKLRHRLHS